MAEYKTDLDELKKLFTQSKNTRSKLEADWYLNLSYYMGDQWVFWNRGRIDRPKLEDWRVMFTDNRILPTVVARVAKMTKNRPTFICTPATGDEDDMHNAEIGEQILRYYWRELDLDYYHLLVEFWKEICGAGFWKISWDKTKGEGSTFLYGPDGNVVKQPKGEAPLRADSKEAEVLKQLMAQQGAELSEKEVSQGDLSIEVISPFEIFPDPLAKTLNECEWIIEEKIRSKEYITKRYGAEFGKQAKEDAEIPIGIAESRMFQSNSYEKHQAKGVKVYEYFCRPNSKHPEGKWAVWFGDTLVRDEPIDKSPFESFPYVMFSSNLVPGRFWPTPITTHLRGPQTDLNKLQSQIRENAIRIGNPPVAISREANVEWSGKPGAKILYSDTVQNALPTFIAVPEVPTYVREEIDRIQNSITEISGLHEISKASVPTGVTAASAINLLLEADDTRLGPEIQLMEKSLAVAGTKVLKLVAKFADDSRTIRIAGEDGGWDIFSFKGEVLNKIVNVDVEAGSGMPQSKAARQAAMQELLALALQYGVPLNPRSMRRFFKDYQMGGLDRLFQDLENDEAQITREHRRLYKGEDLLINMQDNDDLHIESHEEEMKSAKFEKAPDEIKAKFHAHLVLHKEERMKAVEAQVQTMQQEQIGQAQSEQNQAMMLEAMKQQGGQNGEGES